LFAAPVSALLEDAGALKFLSLPNSTLEFQHSTFLPVDVGQVQPHEAVFGNLLSYVEVRPRQVRLGRAPQFV
jgi:hypothetical protein